MSDADTAYAAARAEIARVKAAEERGLNLSGKSFAGLDRLPPEIADLDGPRRLDLNGTAIADLAPLAGLTALQSLSLRQTGVTDLAPLAGLTALKLLSLDQTGVSDLRPIAGLDRLASGERGSGLSFDGLPTRGAPPELARLAAIKDRVECARETLA